MNGSNTTNKPSWYGDDASVPKGVVNTLEEMDAAIDTMEYIAEVASRDRREIRIKPLDWQPADDGGIWAYNPVTGNYKVLEFVDEWIAVGLGPYPSLEMAKDACSQRHERSIRSQIET